jgi:hypothetical protein
MTDTAHQAPVCGTRTHCGCALSDARDGDATANLLPRSHDFR